MTNEICENPKIEIDFPRSPIDRIEEVTGKKAPRDSLLGYFQLVDNGWDVAFSDSRWKGRGKRVYERLKPFFEVPDIDTLRAWRESDLVVLTTRFSLLLLLCTKLVRKPAIILDVTQNLPRRIWKRFYFKACLMLANRVVVYSASQADEWSNELNTGREKFSVIRYGIDLAFYGAVARQRLADETLAGGFILAVGRDPKRDFPLLVKAASVLAIPVKIVSLPYLVPAEIRDAGNVELVENVSYGELLSLYSSALMAVVPIKEEVSYMAGIRAVMEAMATGVPVVATHTPGLDEYFEGDRDLVFVKPGSVQEMVDALKSLREDAKKRVDLAKSALQKMSDFFDVNDTTMELEGVYRSVAYDS